MKRFLFRAPLLDIDPSNELEIISNWDSILKIIAVSSSSLLQKISFTPYPKLHPRLKKKVYKYILRGRYRPTPFGLLAGVGIAECNDSHKFILNLSRITTLSSAPIATSTDSNNFFLADGNYEKWGRIHFLTFQQNAGRWGLVNLQKNGQLERIIHQVNQGKTTNFELFRTGFENATSNYVKEIWDNMISLGILYPEGKAGVENDNKQRREDMVFTDEISIPHSTFAEIKDFYQNSGTLFKRTKNAYLASFHDWFVDKFDDRFVPLNLLLTYDEFNNLEFLPNLSQPSLDQKLDGIPMGMDSVHSLDLKEHSTPQSLDPAIYDLQVVFKLRGDATLIMENIVCNRPFVYFGRFNKNARIFEEQKKIKESIYQDREVIYAELKLFETENVASICDTEPVFKSFISPFSETATDCINYEDIELGYIAGEYVLVHKKILKKIIPVIIHPLNGKEISHPIMRLLWEISHQNPRMFTPYLHRKYRETSYIPQLNWGKIVLQSRRWLIYNDSFSDMEKLHQWLVSKSLPHPLQMGYLDRELVIHWNRDTDLLILWEELIKWKRLVLSDPIWLKKPLYLSSEKRAIYPQFVVHQSTAKTELPLPDFINSISRPAEDCLYILIRIPENSFLTFLEFFFCERVLGLLKTEKVQWYYVVYPDVGYLQFRLRFLRLNPAQKSQLMHMNSLKYEASNFHYEFRPYYPEFKKYGNDDYIKSEQLFNLESSLMLSIDIGNQEDWVIGNNNLKLGLMVNLWMKVLVDNDMTLLLFDLLKHRVKSLSRIEVKELRSYSEQLKTSQTIPSSYCAWQKLYLKTIAGHSYLSKDHQSSSRFLLNHIHMQVNRFFPTDRKRMEDLIHYLLYNRLCKRLYHT